MTRNQTALDADECRKRMDEIYRLDAPRGPGLRPRDIESAHCEQDRLVEDLLAAAIEQGDVPSWITDAAREMLAYEPQERWYA